MVNVKKTHYAYKDEQGVTLFEKIRIEPGYDGKPKSFYYEREENGVTIQNNEGSRKVLYRLPELLDGVSRSQPIFLVEGEKDADNLVEKGLIASTAPVTITWHEEYTQLLKDADVVILYDYDKAGFKRRDLITDRLYGKVKRLRVVDLPDIEYSENHGKDVSDWLAMGNTIAKLLEIVEKTQDYIPSNEQQEAATSLRAVSIEELFALDLPPREMLLAPFLPSQGLVLLVAKRGVGKTHIALGIAYAVASGGTFLRWNASIAKKVLYVDGEMPAVLMQERLRMIAAMSNTKADPEFFKLITPDLQTLDMPDLAQQEGRDTLEAQIKDFDLIVLDNISCLFRSGSENEADSWQEAQAWALRLRRQGKSILFIHHAGKNGAQRGTSKKEDALDTVIILKHPEDYKHEQGARFEVQFDKARHFSGDDARSFQVQLVEDNGKWKWEMSNDPEEELLNLIADMKAGGKTILEIMTKTGRTKSQVETLTIKAKARGLLM